MFHDLSPGQLIEPLTGAVWDRPRIQARLSARRADYQRRGLAPGDRVFLHFGNTAEFLIEVLAIWSAGGCVVPIDPRFTEFRLHIWHQLHTVKPRNQSCRKSFNS
jgi:acyl-CoA synthetase (AMP-forming)/AMP-acid ligase II